MRKVYLQARFQDPLATKSEFTAENAETGYRMRRWQTPKLRKGEGNGTVSTPSHSQSALEEVCVSQLDMSCSNGFALLWETASSRTLSKRNLASFRC